MSEEDDTRTIETFHRVLARLSQTKIATLRLRFVGTEHVPAPQVEKAQRLGLDVLLGARGATSSDLQAIARAWRVNWRHTRDLCLFALASLPEPDTQHGGKRAGAGRHPLDPSGPKVRLSVCLAPVEVAHCEQLGGTVQAGIVQLIRESMKK